VTAPRRRPPGRRRVRPLAVVIALVGLVVVAVFAVGWLERSETDRVELGTPSRVVVVSEAGPLEVAEAEGTAALEVAASYLVLGPEVDTIVEVDRTVVVVRCPGWTPCRTASRLEVPPGTIVEAVVVDDVVNVGPFSGELHLTVEDGHVAVGPVSGPLVVLTGSASVRATDLRTDTATIRSVSGPVDVTARVAPVSLTIEAVTSPVRLRLPAGPYHLALQGEPLHVEGIESVRRRANVVTVDTGGPVSVTALAED
jgi:hypothetical protein